MKDTKYRLETLCFYDYRGVEEHLCAMAARGWRLEKAGNTLWKYRRTEPAKLRYAVTYHDEASHFNPGPTAGQRSLEELCAAAGWEKVCDWAQMQIFRTENPDAVPLETDDAVRLEGIRRSMKKNFIPGNLVLLVLGLLWTVRSLYVLTTDPVRFFGSNGHLFSAVMFLLVLLIQSAVLLQYVRWRRKSLRSVAEGGTCAPPGPGWRRLNQGGLILIVVFAALYLLAELSGGGGYALLFLAYMALYTLLVVLLRLTTALLRKRGVSKAANMALTLAVDVVLACAITGGMVFGATRLGWFSGQNDKETYVFQDMVWDASPAQDFPLTFTDITGRRYEHISRDSIRGGSVFLPERSYRETVLCEDGGTDPLKKCHLSYTIWDPAFTWLEEALTEDLQYKWDFPDSRRAYVSEDPAPWMAEAVYRLCTDGAAGNTWILVWPGRVVQLTLDSPPPNELLISIAVCLHLVPEA